MIVSQWAGVFAADIGGSGGSKAEDVQQQSAAEMLKGRDYARDQLIVTFDDGISNSGIKSVVNKKDASCETIAKVAGGNKAAQVDISEDDSMKQAIVKFQSDSRVKSVQPNYRYETETADPYLDTGAGLNYQYQLKDTNAEAAWTDLEAGNHGRTLVAVIDTGVDVGHEDLQANMKTEKAGTYIRTLDGKRVEAADDSDETDGHGTHVTGIIGATYDNGKGGSGIASGHNNDLVQVMTVGTSSDGVSMYTFDLVNAIEYSVEKGAGVINMSLGGAGRDRVLEAAVKKAYDSGVVIVAASGKEGGGGEWGGGGAPRRRGGAPPHRSLPGGPGQGPGPERPGGDAGNQYHGAPQGPPQGPGHTAGRRGRQVRQRAHPGGQTAPLLGGSVAGVQVFQHLINQAHDSLPPAADGTGPFRIPGRIPHMAAQGLMTAFSEYGHEGLVAQDIDQAGNAAAGLGQGFEGRRGKGILAQQPGHFKTVGHIGRHLRPAQGLNAVMEGNALTQLTQAFLGQFFIQFGLAEHDPLEQLALLGFQIGQETEGFQTGLGHGLGFIDTHHGRFTRLGNIQQALVEGLE